MITVKAFIESIKPDWSIADWLAWPPDVFALTSMMLKQTGAYIAAVLPPGDEDWPAEYQWQEKLELVRREWYEWIFDKSEENGPGESKVTNLPELIRNHVAIIEANLSEVTIDEIHLVATQGYTALDSHLRTNHGIQDNHEIKDRKQRVWDVCRAVLELHALADEACAGFGIPSSAEWRTPSSPSDSTFRLKTIDYKAIQYISNMLLAHTGTLSRLPTNVVRVLPKLRTPNVGLTLRGFSHHVTVHQTEVDVRWRTMPWVNIDENTINILIIPWPYKIEPTWFSPSAYTTHRLSSERTRYFHYSGSPEGISAHDVLALIKDAEKSVHRVHMIVFPELALTNENLIEILDTLASNQERDQIPMVLAGIRSDGDMLSRNTVVLSSFFAGKWYQMKQDKHHRWKLNESQIQQYNIGGALAASKEWWEAIELYSRRLSVLAPNNWLTLCPLICEDLARLEPVSEIIRGIGPTLVVAILLDGPQIQDRWPGRYASVLADDPGSSVLTVTALGLTNRSISKGSHSKPQTIALWKDNVKGWNPIEIEEGKKGVVLTVSAHWREETTLDGRSDHGSGAVFVWQGVHQVDSNGYDHKPNNNLVRTARNPFLRSGPTDLLEMTILSYLVDGVIEADSLDEVKMFKSWIMGDEKGISDSMRGFRPAQTLLEKLRPHIQTLKPNENSDVRAFVTWFCELVYAIQAEPEIHDGQEVRDFKYFRQLTSYARTILSRITEPEFLHDYELHDDPFEAVNRTHTLQIPPPVDRTPRSLMVRVYIYSSLEILWAVHARVNHLRRQGTLNRNGANLLVEIEELLKRNYDDVWYQAISRFKA